MCISLEGLAKVDIDSETDALPSANGTANSTKTPSANGTANSTKMPGNESSSKVEAGLVWNPSALMVLLQTRQVECTDGAEPYAQCGGRVPIKPSPHECYVMSCAALRCGVERAYLL